MLRIVLFPLTGAVAAAGVMALVQLLLLRAGNAGAPAPPLPDLLAAMSLGRYALLGAVTGAVLAPWPARLDRAATGSLRWLLVAPLVAAVTPLVSQTFELGRLPAAGELLDGYVVRLGDGLAAVAAAVGCAIAELLGVLLARRRLRREGRIHVAADSRADVVLAHDRDERVRRYLESRRQPPRG
jgi:hypothetical protein